jgi:hypothetical protein
MFGKRILRMFPELEQETIIAFTIEWILNLTVSVGAQTEHYEDHHTQKIKEEEQKKKQILKLSNKK